MTQTPENLSRLRPGESTLVELDGQPVAVANVSGMLYAFEDLCPHRQCSLSEGRLEGKVIHCPCHGSQFDVTTGEVIEGPARRALATYQIEALGGAIQVEAATAPPTATEAEREETANALSHVAFFAGIDADTLATLQDLAFRKTFPIGEVIVAEGRTGNGAYVVVSGKVEVVRGLPDRPQVVATFGPGEPFGELALLGDWKRTASVIAVEETTCIGLDRWVFLAYLRREPRLAATMMQLLAQRLVETDPELAISALQQLAERIVEADRRLYG
jgi:CRP-like cAMP-binding protein/nitrite reductase/ring-hydroxylating ferredoxin subunit